MEIRPQDCLIILDDGHGDDTAGKRTPHFPDGSFVKENSFNRHEVELIRIKLETRGFNVFLTAPELEDVPLNVRTDRANAAYVEWKKDHDKAKCIFISIHFNAFNGVFDDKKGGIETYAYKEGTEAAELAACLHAEIIRGTSQNNRGVKYSAFWVLRKTWMVAALIEFGFMDLMEEAVLMNDPRYMEECAEETCIGLCKYLGVEYGVSQIDALTKELAHLKAELTLIRDRINGLLI